MFHIIYFFILYRYRVVSVIRSVFIFCIHVRFVFIKNNITYTKSIRKKSKSWSLSVFIKTVFYYYYYYYCYYFFFLSSVIWHSDKRKTHWTKYNNVYSLWMNRMKIDTYLKNWRDICFAYQTNIQQCIYVETLLVITSSYIVLQTQK